MSNETNEILTIAGERVEVRYESDFYEACGKCCFHNIFVACNVRTLCHGCPCDKYSDDKNRRFAYFVRAEEIANKPQTDANKNEPTREQKADFLQTSDADKAADAYIGHPYEIDENDNYVTKDGKVFDGETQEEIITED